MRKALYSILRHSQAHGFKIVTRNRVLKWQAARLEACRSSRIADCMGTARRSIHKL